jgi:endonuclease/exonuclease/phosphatase (EEP) superfamily protein YafD
MTYPADSGVKRIDYLYLVAGAECSEATVINTQASDHRPVLYVLRM